MIGVSDGARTRDIRDHNPMLCQLSYTHHQHDIPEFQGLYNLQGKKSTVEPYELQKNNRPF